MSNDHNPYSAPSPTEAPVLGPERLKPDWFGLISWPIALGLNMIVPLFIGWQITASHGRFGLLAASAVFLVGGWTLALVRPAMHRRLVLGSVFAALSQVFPVVHLIAGLVGFEIASRLGLAVFNDDVVADRVLSELGGFVITMIVGTILIAFAAMIGLLVSLVLPAEWFSSKKRTPRYTR